jgi:flagellar basal-body rod protein FlgB
MDVSNIGLFALAEQRLAWVDKRQGLLAQNIANADTPGWQSRDVAPFAAALAQTGAGALAQTSPMHLAAPEGQAGNIKLAGLHGPDGNGVALDAQLAQVVDTETVHDLVDDLYKKYIGFFKTAIGK